MLCTLGKGDEHPLKSWQFMTLTLLCLEAEMSQERNAAVLFSVSLAPLSQGPARCYALCVLLTGEMEGLEFLITII